MCVVQVRNPLDPFLQKLSMEYTDDADLSRRLLNYFQVCWWEERSEEEGVAAAAAAAEEEEENNNHKMDTIIMKPHK